MAVLWEREDSHCPLNGETYDWKNEEAALSDSLLWARRDPHRPLNGETYDWKNKDRL